MKKILIIGKVGPKNVYGVTNNPYKDSEGRPTNGATFPIISIFFITRILHEFGHKLFLFV